ncbi:hypothetical protein H1N86_gp05 [Escherichia phage vB_EcoS_G29-2]|uniref:Uncharacterized protein n=1 Tax=Escherichia phage vB_EcoS_G29-2 TaxID=2508189 RepID=A0A482N7C3_9CAUD|nr:hypothetical protein H1N86_gp05 [Escherichia phage vB_EcoS_G29-2]QBQ81459.1 hypothetical protein G292_00005 [Escherichia phage vB_EcoS_G29-2]
MLKLADIKFPITFESRGVGHFMFTDEKTCTKFNEYGSPNASTMEIEHFIEAHNKHYNSLRDYGYAMPGYTCFHYKPYKGQVLPMRAQDIASAATYARAIHAPENAEPLVKMHAFDYKKLWCLSVDNIKYPITFRSAGNSTIRYTSRDNGVYGDGQKSELKVDFFVNGHNKFNPHNEKDKVYYVEDITKHLFGETPFGGGKTSIAQAIDNVARRIGEQIHSQTIKASGGWRIDKSVIACQEIVTQGAIEDMPLGASIIGIKDDNGDWQDVSFPVKQIEVHDDLICLLAHHGSYRDKAFAAELNIKRGTMVKWKVKA